MTIYRGIEKINQEVTIEQYDGIARPGEVVTAQISDSAPEFAAYLADANGNLHLLGGGGGNGSPAGSTGQVQFNNAGNFAASANLTFDSNIGILSATYGNFTGVVTEDITAAGFIGVQGDVIVGGDLTPSENVTSDLGSPSNRWKDLYLSNNTIYLGDTTLSANGNGLTVDGQAVVTSGANSSLSLATLAVTGTTELGDVSNVTITGGSNSEVLTTDGTGNLYWSSVSIDTANYANTAGHANTANTANSATVADTANSVAAANITGTVSFATAALSANTANSVAGANVSGEVAYAATANAVAGANVTGTVANAAYATQAGSATAADTATSATSATTAATVTTAAQPNITSVGTLTELSVNGSTFLGDANIGNLIVRGTTTTANVADINVANATIVIASGANALVANGAGLFVGNDITPVASMSVDTAANVWTFDIGVTAPAANITGTATAAHFAGEAGNLSNITAANVTGTVANATHAATAGSANTATTAATVTTAAQPNITSVGTLANLTVSGNSALGNITSGDWQGNVITPNYGGTGTNTSTGTGSLVLSASPVFTGTPEAPTANTGANTAQIATTAFVTSALANLSPSIPVNSVLVFAQSAAPTGWVKLSIANDAALRIVSGSSGGGLGGNVGFLTAFSVSRTPSGTIANTTATGTVGNTALTVDQIPSHNHGISDPGHRHNFTYFADNAGGYGLGAFQLVDRTPRYTGSSEILNSTTGISINNTGGSNYHNHSFTGAAHNHTFTGSAMDFSVKYVDAILCIKT